LDIIRAMQGEMGVNSLIFTITQRTIRVVEADRCTLYLVDNVHRGLFAMQGEVMQLILKNLFLSFFKLSFSGEYPHFHGSRHRWFSSYQWTKIEYCGCL
jgi:hypothetical protein